MTEQPRKTFKYITVQQLGAARVSKRSNSIEEARKSLNRFATGPLEIFELTAEVNTGDVFYIHGSGEGYLISDVIRDGRLPYLLKEWESVLDEVQLDIYKRVEVIQRLQADHL